MRSRGIRGRDRQEKKARPLLSPCYPFTRWVCRRYRSEAPSFLQGGVVYKSPSPEITMFDGRYSCKGGFILTEYELQPWLLLALYAGLCRATYLQYKLQALLSPDASFYYIFSNTYTNWSISSDSSLSSSGQASHTHPSAFAALHSHSLPPSRVGRTLLRASQLPSP